ncbi:MAG: cytochrome c family protein [Myxococcales bacterium]|nr:cytochrome c family protein [Myxococcales bacterium]
MQLFPRSLNYLPLALAVGAAGLGVSVTFVFWYYFSPKNLQVGYAPEQPVDYSHKLHAGDLGIDCRYCHANVERSQEAMVPPTQTCMGCHSIVKKDSPKLAALRDSWDSGNPVQWVRVHKLPDHVFFDHSAHLAVGVGCVSCHGRVDQMDVVRLEEPISMGWCLDCHRDPQARLRPKDQITNMTWSGGDGELALAEVNPPEHCSGCHR